MDRDRNLEGYLSIIEDVEDIASQAESVFFNLIATGQWSIPDVSDKDETVAIAAKTIQDNKDYIGSYIEGMPIAVVVHVLATLLAGAMKTWLKVPDNPTTI